MNQIIWLIRSNSCQVSHFHQHCSIANNYNGLFQPKSSTALRDEPIDRDYEHGTV